MSRVDSDRDAPESAAVPGIVYESGMKLMLFPEVLRPHVEATVAKALGSGPEALTLTVVHMP